MMLQRKPFHWCWICLLFSTLAVNGCQKATTVNVKQTVSGVPCRNGEKCSNKRYAEFYCYTDASYWEPCCGQPDSCQSGEAKSESYCATTDAGGGKKARCRPNALAVTLSGRRCARDSFCGYYNQNYQWCWLDKEHTMWDHCCFPGSQCTIGSSDYGHYIWSCSGCKDEYEIYYDYTWGEYQRRKVCKEQDIPCNTVAQTRSVNNYECVSPCSQDGTEYSWCWVKANKQAWDWCCFIGETCGVVYTRDKQKTGKKCYTKNGQRWPTDCTVASEPTPLPWEYQSPPTPLGWRAITGIGCVLGGALFGSALLIYCYRRN